MTRLDQDSAEVLTEVAAALSGAPLTARQDWFRRAVADHWKYSQAATIASGSIEMQRLLLSRSMLAAS